MKKNRWIYILLLVLLIPVESQAQRWRLQRYEAALGLGPTHTFMDIGPMRNGITSFQLPGTRPNVTFDARFRILEPLAVKLSLSYVQFGGVDNYENLTVKYFVANAFEPAVSFEYYLLGAGRTLGFSGVYNRKGMVNNYNNLSLYVFGGVGGLLSKANGYDENRDLVLNDPYFDNNSYFNVVIPVGLGIKYSIDSDWSIGVEVGARFTFTDLIDGYTTPFSQYNDKYALTNFKAIYKIRNDRRGVPIFRRGGGRR